MAVVDRGVDVDGKSLGLGGLDRRDRAVEHAVLADRLVVVVLEPVEVNEKNRYGDGSNRCSFFSSSSALVHSETISSCAICTDDLTDLAMDQRLAAGIATMGAPHSSTASSTP